ncbi:MAG: hypothetical protein IPP94_10185 [Ignavibacteria bacterium]|nr:hypothetical protein [Ignavibacteria bacterium]
MTQHSGNRTITRLLATILTLALCAGLSSCSKPRGDTAAAKRAMDKGLEFFRAGNPDSAAVYFKTATDADPDNATAWAWRAKVMQYQQFSNTAGSAVMDSCAAYARRALAIDPNNAFAHVELAHAYNPQYGGMTGVNATEGYEKAWEHLNLAVQYDDTDGDAWIGICLQAMRRGDAAMEKKALARMLESGFFTPAIVEMNAWMLRAMPENAILITSGDFDTFPMWALQTARGMRPDVAVLNSAMLNAPWYAEAACARNRIPLPMSRAELDEYTPGAAYFYKEYKVPMPKGLEERMKDPNLHTNGVDDPRFLAFSDAAVRWWAEQKRLGKFPRPIAIAATCDGNVRGLFDLRGIDCGTHTQWTEREASGAVDLAATKKAFDDAKPALFTGPQCAAHDRSMYRSTREADASAMLPFSSGIAYMKACRAAGMAAEADAYRVKLEHFAQEAKLSPTTVALLEEVSGAGR